MEYSVTVLLKHFSVRVETRVTQFGNLFRQEFDSVRRVTEDDRLIDLELYIRHRHISLRDRKIQMQQNRNVTFENKVFKQ